VKRIDSVDISVRAIFHAVLVASLYLLFVGHNHPGGGFVGGLVAGAAIAMRYVAGGIDSVRSLTPVKPWGILGAGIVIAGITATVPLLAGQAPLQADTADLHLPIFGDVHLASTLAFDVGVYLVVVGLVFMVFEAFGDDITDTPRDLGTDVAPTRAASVPRPETNPPDLR
jgi:multicomponent Na+:H+ antiporter subunit A